LYQLGNNQAPSDHCFVSAPSDHSLQTILTALTASYGDQERLVWEQLSGLVRDAAWLESYIVATMLLVKEAMQVREGALKG
jgi:hypothetical protein